MRGNPTLSHLTSNFSIDCCFLESLDLKLLPPPPSTPEAEILRVLFSEHTRVAHFETPSGHTHPFCVETALACPCLHLTPGPPWYVCGCPRLCVLTGGHMCVHVSFSWQAGQWARITHLSHLPTSPFPSNSTRCSISNPHH